MEKFENNIQKIEYKDLNRMLVQIWTEQSKSLNNEDFKTEMLKLADFFDKYQPEKILIDMQNFYFVVTPDLQEWVDNNVNVKLLNENSKTAFIVSPDLFAAVSVEQTLDEEIGKKINRQFFKDEQKARKWLLS